VDESAAASAKELTSRPDSGGLHGSSRQAELQRLALSGDSAEAEQSGEVLGGGHAHCRNGRASHRPKGPPRHVTYPPCRSSPPALS
jgi:hypothetical protein